jgi:hypothetical protein
MREEGKMEMVVPAKNSAGSFSRSIRVPVNHKFATCDLRLATFLRENEFLQCPSVGEIAFRQEKSQVAGHRSQICGLPGHSIL